MHILDYSSLLNYPIPKKKKKKPSIRVEGTKKQLKIH